MKIKNKIISLKLVQWIVSWVMILSIGLLSTTVFAVTMQLDRNVIKLNETVQLRIVSQTNAPVSLAPFEDNFSVVNQSTTRNVSLVNGVMDSQITYLLTLLPKRAGKLIVPSITVGNERSNSLILTVQEIPTFSSNEERARNLDSWMDVEISPSRIYSGQLSTLKINLYTTGRLINGNLDIPKINDARVIQLQDQSRVQVIANKRINVHTREYLIDAIGLGQLKVPAMKFNGIVNVPNQRTSRQIFLQSEEKVIELLPKESSYQGEYWLPAKDLQITSSMGHLKNQTVQAGQSLSFDVVITARQYLAESLPQDLIKGTDQYKVYSDKPVYSNLRENEGVKSTVTQRYTIIPTQSGEIKIPELRLNWWDTDENIEKVANMAEKIITVTGVFDSANVPTDNSNNAQDAQSTLQSNQMPGLSAMIYTLALMGCLIAVCGYLLRARLAGFFSKKTDLKKPITQKQALKMAVKYARHNDPQKTYQALLLWAAHGPSDNVYMSLKQKLQHGASAELIEEVDKLEKALFKQSKENQPWRGQALSKAISTFSSKRKIDNKNKSLGQSNLLLSLYAKKDH